MKILSLSDYGIKRNEEKLNLIYMVRQMFTAIHASSKGTIASVSDKEKNQTSYSLEEPISKKDVFLFKDSKLTSKEIEYILNDALKNGEIIGTRGVSKDEKGELLMNLRFKDPRLSYEDNYGAIAIDFTLNRNAYGELDNPLEDKLNSLTDSVEQLKEELKAPKEMETSENKVTGQNEIGDTDND